MRTTQKPTFDVVDDFSVDKGFAARARAHALGLEVEVGFSVPRIPCSGWQMGRLLETLSSVSRSTCSIGRDEPQSR